MFVVQNYCTDLNKEFDLPILMTFVNSFETLVAHKINAQYEKFVEHYLFNFFSDIFVVTMKIVNIKIFSCKTL